MPSTSPILAFFDLGSGEMMLIMLVILIFFGGDKLPGFARGLGKAIREFKKASSGVEEEIRRAMAEPPPPPRPPVVSSIGLPPAVGAGEIVPDVAQAPSIEGADSAQTSEGENDKASLVAPAAPAQTAPAAATLPPASTGSLPQQPEN